MIVFSAEKKKEKCVENAGTTQTLMIKLSFIKHEEKSVVESPSRFYILEIL